MDKDNQKDIETNENDNIDLQNKLLEELKLDNGELCYSKDFNEEYYNCCWEFETPFGIMTARYGKIKVL